MTELIIPIEADLDVLYYIEEALAQYIDYYKMGGNEEDEITAKNAERAYDLIKEYAYYGKEKDYEPNNN